MGVTYYSIHQGKKIHPAVKYNNIPLHRPLLGTVFTLLKNMPWIRLCSSDLCSYLHLPLQTEIEMLACHGSGQTNKFLLHHDKSLVWQISCNCQLPAVLPDTGTKAARAGLLRVVPLMILEACTRLGLPWQLVERQDKIFWVYIIKSLPGIELLYSSPALLSALWKLACLCLRTPFACLWHHPVLTPILGTPHLSLSSAAEPPCCDCFVMRQ